MLHVDKYVFLISMLVFYEGFFLLFEFWDNIRSVFARTLIFFPFRSHRRRSSKQNKNTQEGGRTLLRKKENITKKHYILLPSHCSRLANSMQCYLNWRRKTNIPIQCADIIGNGKDGKFSTSSRVYFTAHTIIGAQVGLRFWGLGGG